MVDLDTSFDEEGTGWVVISKQEMRSRLRWFSTKSEPYMKQETETMDRIQEVEKIHEVVWMQNTQEKQLEDAPTPVDTLEFTDAIKDDCG